MDNRSKEAAGIGRLASREEAEFCARVMSGSEPWMTLGRSFQDSLKLVMDPGRETYVARVNGQPAGFVIILMHGAFTGYIQSIGVAEGWRGQGIGSRLMAFAEERIFTETANVFLCVSSFNPGARRLYERLGYQVVGELKDYIIRGQSEILMRKALCPLRDFQKRRL